MKPDEIKSIIKKTKEASEELLNLTSSQREDMLLCLAKKIEKEKQLILEENKKDIKEAQKNHLDKSMIERLSLNEERISNISSTIKSIAHGKDVLFKNLEVIKRPNGIKIKKVSFPIGIIAIIYESRPNVTLDTFSLCFKSGNGVILKGGKEIKNTNEILISIIKKVLSEKNINQDVVGDLNNLEKKQIKEILKNKSIDCLIPRGSKGLIDFVSENSIIPIIKTGASVVHTYIDKSADLNMAKKIILNAKGRRVSICNALDTILLHNDIKDKFLKLSANDLKKQKIEIRADNKVYETLEKIKYPFLKKASPQDFDTEFLDYILSAKTVKDLSEAISHIKKHSLGHSEAIITKSKKQASRFFKEIDSACLYHNTSTQFSDGEEYGMNGEIGISIQKLHARGPFDYKSLVTYKYLVESEGSIRK